MKLERILIAPLDWGLGHATRSIPLIRYFLSKKKEVYIASSGPALKLLKLEFPKLRFFELPAYNIHYKHDSMILNMALQLPKMRAAILKENQAVAQIVEDNKFDLIISDNRYGVYHPKVKSIFMGHQLAIQMPNSLKAFSNLAFKWHRKMLSPFHQVWVPDFEGVPNLSGRLSQQLNMQKELCFIGPLSRFNFDGESKESLSLLIILSGQEPQRTDFENLLLSQIDVSMGQVELLRGLPQNTNQLNPQQANIKVFNHLSAKELQSKISAAELVVCRSGYSSIMDMATMRKKVLLVPTPGQTEQEYLAQYLRENKWAYAVEQKDLNLKSDLQQLEGFDPLEMPNLNLDKNIERALNR